MKRLLIIVVLVLAAPCLVSGQPQPVPSPKPGPEIQRLGSLYEWFAGGYSVIGHVENSGPEGKSSERRIITYDPDAKDYTQYRVTSTAPGGTMSRLTVTGNTWLSQRDGTEDGKPAKYRFSIVEVRPTSSTGKARGFSGWWAVDCHL